MSSPPNISPPAEDVATALYELDVEKEIKSLATESINKRRKGTKSSIGRLPGIKKEVLRAKAVFNVNARIQSLSSEGQIFSISPSSISSSSAAAAAAAAAAAFSSSSLMAPPSSSSSAAAALLPSHSHLGLGHKFLSVIVPHDANYRGSKVFKCLKTLFLAAPELWSKYSSGAHVSVQLGSASNQERKTVFEFMCKSVEAAVATNDFLGNVGIPASEKELEMSARAWVTHVAGVQFNVSPPAAKTSTVSVEPPLPLQSTPPLPLPPSPRTLQIQALMLQVESANRGRDAARAELVRDRVERLERERVHKAELLEYERIRNAERLDEDRNRTAIQSARDENLAAASFAREIMIVEAHQAQVESAHQATRLAKAEAESTAALLAAALLAAALQAVTAQAAPTATQQAAAALAAAATSAVATLAACGSVAATSAATAVVSNLVAASPCDVAPRIQLASFVSGSSESTPSTVPLPPVPAAPRSASSRGIKRWLTNSGDGGASELRASQRKNFGAYSKDYQQKLTSRACRSVDSIVGGSKQGRVDVAARLVGSPSGASFNMLMGRRKIQMRLDRGMKQDVLIHQKSEKTVCESLINLLNEHMSISVADRINKSRKMELQGEPALPLQLYEDACFEPPPRPARAITSTRRLNQLSKEKLHRSRGVVNKCMQSRFLRRGIFLPRVYASKLQLKTYRLRILNPITTKLSLATQLKCETTIPGHIREVLTLPEEMRGIDHGFMSLETVLVNQVRVYVKTESLKKLMQVFSLQNPVTGDMVDHPNTIFIAAVGDGFPFTKSLSGFDWIIQFLNFGGLINSKGPFQRRIFGGSVGEKHPLVQLYLDKVYGPQLEQLVKNGFYVDGVKYSLVVINKGDLAWQWYVTGAGSPGGHYYHPTMDANRDMPRLAAGLGPRKGPTAPKALDGPREAEGDAQSNKCTSLTEGIVTDIFVEWRELEPLRQAIERAEAALLQVESFPVIENDEEARAGAVVTARATLSAARAAMISVEEAQSAEYEVAKARIVTLQTASMDAALVRQQKVVAAMRDSNDSTALQVALEKETSLQLIADTRRIAVQTAQSQGGCLPVVARYYDNVLPAVRQQRLQKMEKFRAELTAGGLRPATISTKVVELAAADGHGVTRPPISKLMSEHSTFYPDNLHADLNHGHLLVHQLDNVGSITDREIGQKYWAIDRDQAKQAASVQHQLHSRFNSTSLKIVVPRLTAQVEKDVWGEGDRRKPFDPVKEKMLKFRIIGQQAYNLLEMFPFFTDVLFDALEPCVRPLASPELAITLNYLHAQLVALELSFHLVRQLSTFAAKYSVPEEFVAVHVGLGDDLFALLNLMGWKCGANEWQICKGLPNAVRRTRWRVKVVSADGTIIYHHLCTGLSGNMEAAEHSHAILRIIYLAYAHKRDGTWLYLMENESIVCEHGPPRVPAAFNYTPTHRRRMLDADAAVPAKMVSVLLRSISINQPSAATDASASMSPASSTSSAASSFVTSSLSSTSVSSGHALQVLMQAPKHASSISNTVPRFDGFLHSSPPVTASYAPPVPSSSFEYMALQATQDYLKRKRIEEFVEQERRRSTARLKASAGASAKVKRLAPSCSSNVTASSAADLSAGTGPIVSPLPLVCGLCRVRPQEVGTSSCRIGHLSANAGECCRRCNVTAEVYELLHTYRSFHARENHWFTNALAKIRSSAGRYSGLIADLGTNHFTDEDNGLYEDNSGGDSEGTIDPVTGAHDLAGGGDIPQEREGVVEPLVAQLVLPLIPKLKAKTRSSVGHPPQAFSAVSNSFQQAPSSQPMVRRSLSVVHPNVVSSGAKKKSTSLASKLRK